MMRFFNKELKINFLFFSFLFIYTTVIIFLCNELNIETDEFFTLNTTSNSLAKVIEQSYNFENQPPVYFILLSWWRNINSGILFARLFSVLSIGLAAFTFYKLVRLFSNPLASRWLVILFLLNPFVVWASVEARLYAFVLFLSVAAIYFFFRFYVENKNKYLYLLGLTGIIALYTMFFYIFLLVSLGFALLLFKGWKIFFKFFLYSMPVGLFFLLNLISTVNPLELALINSMSDSVAVRVNTVFHSPQNLILALSMLSFERIFRWIIILVFILLIVLAYFKWYKKQKNNNMPCFEMFNVILISGFVLVIIFSVFFAITGVDYHDKYLTVGFPLFFMTFTLFTIFTLFNSRVIFVTISLFYISLLISQYRYPVKEYDTRGFIKYISTIEKKNEPLCFYVKLIALPVMHYYNGKNTIVPLPDGLRFDSNYMSKIKDTLELSRAMEKINTSAKSCILITDRMEPRFQNDADLKILNGYLTSHYNITFDTVFYGHSKSWPLRIRRLEKK